MLVYGLISPHPPVILPEVGGPDLPQVRRTIEALKQAVAALAQTRPDRLIIISPHEDHGFAVPERYLSDQLPPHTQLEEILVTEPSYEHYYHYGREIGTEISRQDDRCAIIASGDLSHVLKTDGPYGYHPSGPVLDEQIVAAVRRGDAQALLSIDPSVLDEGAECGLRSILFLFGALEGSDARPEVLSYEGPFGVGYLVATFAPQAGPATSASELTELARQAIQHHLETGQLMATPKPLSPGLARRAGAFVSLHDAAGELRGCIGTIQPTKSSLAAEIIANAVAAATRDPRFEPLELAELDGLTLSVDVLTPPVPEPDPGQLDPKRFGIIVSAPDGRQGVLLPDLNGVDTAAGQIDICRQKAGIGPDEPVEIAKFEVERYAEPA